MRKEKLMNILRVARFIQNNPDTYLREISRALKMDPGKVHRTLKDMGDFIVTRSLNEELQATIPNAPIPRMVTYIRLRPGVTVDGIIRFLGVKEKLEKMKKERKNL